MKRCLVIVHPGSLGDVLLAVPAIRRLGRRYIGREIVLLARESVSRLLVDCGVVEARISLDGADGVGLFSRCVPLPRELQTWLNRCDAAIAWMEDSGDALRATFQACGIAQVWIQSPSSPALRARHQSHRFLETVDEPADDEPLDKFIQTPPDFIEKGTVCLERIGVPPGGTFVLVHPGSGSAHKCLNPETIALIIDYLDQKGLVPVVIEGPADQNVVGRMLEVTSGRPLILRNLDLTTLAGVLVQARFLLGHDSGVTHLAALFGVRTVAVFGPTDPERWAPLGKHVMIVRGPHCLCRSWDEVRQCHEKRCLDVPTGQIFTVLEASGLA